jgi:hypothetical protein
MLRQSIEQQLIYAIIYHFFFFVFLVLGLAATFGALGSVLVSIAGLRIADHIKTNAAMINGTLNH